MMKTMLHKLGRTGVAMFWGWLAFVVVLPVLAAGVSFAQGRAFGDLAGVWVAFALYSVPVVIVAWWAVAFPVDCLIPARSWMRRPVPAALLGVLLGGLPFLLRATWDKMHSWESWWREVARLAEDADVWLWQGGAMLTGLVAALRLARRYPPGATDAAVQSAGEADRECPRSSRRDEVNLNPTRNDDEDTDRVL